MSSAAGVPEAKVVDVNRWRDSDAYSPLERLALEYAEALTHTPVDVPGELVTALRAHLTEAQLVELTTHVLWEGVRARFNRAFEVESQGFAGDLACPLPASPPRS